jgi:hypothetical protein
MFNQHSITEVLLPAKVCDCSYIRDKLKNFDIDLKKHNPDYKDYEIWLLLELGYLATSYTVTLCALSDNRSFLYMQQLRPGLSVAVVRQLYKFSDNYRQKSRTSIKQLMCIEQLCIQSLILDIYKHISYWLKMQLPYWRHNISM